MSRILLTGGAGFIGSHLADKLISLGYEVDIIDDLSTGKKENLNPKANFVYWDISNLYIGGRLDYVFHLAAMASVPKSIEHPTKSHRINIDGTYNILKSALDCGAKKVIFASSCAVYGDVSFPYMEDDEIHPKSPYAFHKAVGEGYMRLFSEVYGLPTVSLRLFNVYGSRCDPNSEYSLVISRFKKLKSEGKPLPIYGTGNQTRDFVYVDDVVDAFVKAMESDVSNENINICSGESVSINQLADLIGGKKEYFPKREGDVLNISGDNLKAKKLLNWIPKVQIKQGLELF